MVLCAGKTVRRTIFCPEPPRTKTLHEGCGCYILRVVFWEETMEKNHPFEVEFSYIRTAVYKELFANPEKTSVRKNPIFQKFDIL